MKSRFSVLVLPSLRLKPNRTSPVKAFGGSMATSVMKGSDGFVPSSQWPVTVSSIVREQLVAVSSGLVINGILEEELKSVTWFLGILIRPKMSDFQITWFSFNESSSPWIISPFFKVISPASDITGSSMQTNNIRRWRRLLKSGIFSPCW